MRHATKADGNSTVLEAKAAKSRYDGLWATLHRAIGDYYVPQNSAINVIKAPSSEDWTEGLYDTTAIHAAQTFTAGCYDYMLSGEFFDFEAPKKDGVAHPIAKDWYHRCAEIVLELINESNWALKIQEHLQDRNTFGTASIDLEKGKKTLFSFGTTRVGHFFPQSDDDGYIDTMFYEYRWTAKKIVDRFGLDNVSSEVAQAYADDKQKATKLFTVWRKIGKRESNKRESGKIDALNKEYESVWVEEEAKHVLYESGYDEQPFVGSRFAQWGDDDFGWSPAVLILPTVRTLNDVLKSLVTLGEIKVWPRTMVPDNLKDVIAWEAGGVTVYPDSTNNPPQVWGDNAGDYATGKDLVVEFREMVKDAYHVDLFKALAERTKAMTATEVLELVQEKLVNFRPTFARFTSETLDPLLGRMFSMAFREGRFPPVPPEVVIEENGQYSIPEPRPTYVSKIARAMRALENKSTLDFFQQAAFLLDLDPMLLSDNYDLDGMLRGLGDNNSLPTEYKRPEKERDEIRAARQKQIEAQQAAELAKTGSEAARNVGQIPEAARQDFADAIDV
jgi:hypothetical protein